jgi:hypothetical protein
MPRTHLVGSSRRLALVCLLLPLTAVVMQAQRRSPQPDARTRATIDSFVVTVRDLAAWALVTPAAHIPVGALQDSTGNVETVVGSQTSLTTLTPDSVLVPFRRALGAGARAARSQAIGLAYFRSMVLTGDTAAVGVLVVEVEHRSGYRATLLFPFEHTGEHPEFRPPITMPTVLQELDSGRGRTGGGPRRRPRAHTTPARPTSFRA